MFSRAAAEKHNGFDCQNAPGLGGSRCSKTYCFVTAKFCRNRKALGVSKIDRQCMLRKGPVALMRNTFSNTVLFGSLRAASPNSFWSFEVRSVLKYNDSEKKTIISLSRRIQKYGPSKSTTRPLETPFQFPNFPDLYFRRALSFEKSKPMAKR